jgi:hypothetical protein
VWGTVTIVAIGGAAVVARLLYAQDFDGAVIIQAVNDIEMLATNLGCKIWQTIAIL